MAWRVQFAYPEREYQALRPEIDAAIQRVLASGRYVNGPELAAFEAACTKRLGVADCVGVASGMDALRLVFRQLGEAVTIPDYGGRFAKRAAVEAGCVLLRHVGLRVDVHMNGRVEVDPSGAVVEDACQAFGATWQGKPAGSFARFGCFSFHPLKVLGCAGDGGMIACQRQEDADRLRAMRGSSRLDEIQAVILRTKLPWLAGWIERRHDIANRYVWKLPQEAECPPIGKGDIFSNYVIKTPRRDELHAWLTGARVETFIHWPEFPGVLSLPIHHYMTDEEQDYAIEQVKTFFK